MRRLFSVTVTILIITALFSGCVSKSRQAVRGADSESTYSAAAQAGEEVQSKDPEVVSSPNQTHEAQTKDEAKAQGNDPKVVPSPTQTPEAQTKDEEKPQGNNPKVVSSPTQTPEAQTKDGEKAEGKDSEVVPPPNKTPTGPADGDTKTQDKSSDAVSYPVKYDFDSLDKVNDFGGYYIAAPSKVVEDDWLTQLVGGRENIITFKLGKLIYNNNAEYAETYIEFEGKDGVITLIANGASYEYYDNSTQLKRVTVNFLTGKKLEGKQVVKDYTDGKQKIILIIDYNENGAAIPLVMFCAKGDSKDIPNNNFYTIEANE